MLIKAGPLRLKHPTKKQNIPIKDKNLVSNQYTLFDSSYLSHSDYGSSPVKTCAKKRTLFKENSGIQLSQTSNL